MLIEIVACSSEDARTAELAGADRVELCSAIHLGGLTPSLGTMIQTKATVGIPVAPMVRPRPAGSCYTRAEFETMCRDVELFAAHGADFIVTGVLNEDGTLDLERNAELVRRAGKVPVSCHRAFDVVPDPSEALEQLIDLGFCRVLTSGQKKSGLDGAPLIRQMVEQAGGRIDILACGGIRPHNVTQIIHATGTKQIHLGPFKNAADLSTQANPNLTFGAPELPEGTYRVCDGDAVAAVVRAVR